MPSTMPASVSRLAASDLAMPKSVSTSVPSDRTRRLPGLMSRWTMPWSCTACIAEAAWAMRSIAAAGGDAAQPPEEAVQRFAVHELHHQDAVARAGHLVDPVVVDVHDSRMVDRRHRPGLALETHQESRIVRTAWEQHLDGDGAGQDDVLTTPHLTHTTGADAGV